MGDIKVEVGNLIATVTIDRPPANAFTDAMYEGVTEAFISLGDRDDVAVIILRATGKLFCGGNDINSFHTNFETRYAAESAVVRCGTAISSIWKCKKPVIAAVHATCVGAGSAMVAASDFIIAGEGVKIGFAEISMGIPAIGTVARQLVPLRKAREMALTGAPMTVEEMATYGSITKIAPVDQVWAEADALAAKIAGTMCYRAIGIARQHFNMNLDAHVYEKFISEQDDFMDDMLHSHDFKEAVSAFLEKRKPIFNGK